MPLKKNIKRVMVIGSGPIVIGQAANLTMQAHRLAVRLKKKDLRLFS